jgi:predicted ATPase
VGRQANVAEVAGLLGESRLVTLVGPPGVGKTRLALHTAAHTLGRYPGGAWFVDLSLVSQPALVVQAVASAVSVRERAGEDLRQTLTTHLSDRRLLVVVLDNCEHLLDACADLVCRLAPACGNVTILATSREELGLVGEIACPVPTLALPADDSHPEVSASDAARLFLSRVPGRLDLTEATAAPVSRICRRLDGIPLALELAAGRVGELTLQEVEANLDHRFELLRTGRAGIPERQQTMHAALEWSHDLLPEPERVLLRRVSVFAGPFTTDAAHEVASLGSIGEDGATKIMAHLATRSLLVRQVTEGQIHYRQHESIRHFTREKLRATGEEEAIAAAHARWCARLVAQADDPSAAPAQPRSMAALASHHADLRAALAWSVDHDLDLGLALAGGMTRFWVSHGHLEEARTWLERALAGGAGAPATRAKALWGAGLVACLSGDFPAVEPAWRKASPWPVEPGMDERRLGCSTSSA